MILASLRINNFRSFKDEEISFSKYTTLVGANGSGKSTVLSALNILFRNSDSPTDIYHLTEEDFHNRDTTEPIRITATFDEIPDKAIEEMRAYVRQGKLVISAIANWDVSSERATVRQVGSRLVIKDFTQYFKAIEAMSLASELKEIYSRIRIKYQDLTDIKTKDGMRDSLREYEENHPELCELVESDDQFYGFTKGSNKLNKYIQWIYIPAVKDASEEQDETKNTALGRLLQRTIRAKIDFSKEIDSIKSETVTKYLQLLKNEKDVLSTVSESIQKRLQLFSHKGAMLELEWRYDDQKSISIADPSARAKVGEGSFLGDLVRLGHGLQRCFLVAILQELVDSASEDQPSLLLAVEEPELYQHPPQARHLASVFESLSESGSQVMVTSHSPYFVSGKGFENIRMTRKGDADDTLVSQLTHDGLSKLLSKALGEDSVSPTAIMASIEQILQPSQNEMFFTKIPIMVEGTEDVAFISTQLKLSHRWDLFRELGCHFIITQGKTTMSRPLAIARGLQMPVFTIFDADIDRCVKPGDKKKHERDNKCLINLCEVDADPIPTDHYFGSNCVIWKTRILDSVREDFGADTWDTTIKNTREKYDFNAGVRPKHPLLITHSLEMLDIEGKQSKLLNQACDNLLKYAKSV